VRQPVELAALVLDDPNWSQERLDEAIATGRTQTITLPRKLPVLVLYWTAAPTRLHQRRKPVRRAVRGVAAERTAERRTLGRRRRP